MSTSPAFQYQRNPELIAADMDGDTVMMSIQSGRYYGLGGVGSHVWALLEHASTLDSLVAGVCAEFEVDEATCRADLERFLAALQADGLVTSLNGTP